MRTACCGTHHEVLELHFRQLVKEHRLPLTCQQMNRRCGLPGPELSLQELLDRGAPVEASSIARAHTSGDRLRQLEEEMRRMRRQEHESGSRMTPDILPAPILSSFSSGRAIRSWIAEVRRMTAAISLSPIHEVAYAASGLRDAAATDWRTLVYSRLGSSDVVSLAEMEEVLLRHFEVPRSVVEEWEDWGNLRQGPQESAHDYCQRVRLSFNPEYLSEKAAAACLLSRAKPALRAAAMRVAERDATEMTLESISRLLVWEERGLRQTGWAGGGSAASSSSSSSSSSGGWTSNRPVPKSHPGPPTPKGGGRQGKATGGTKRKNDSGASSKKSNPPKSKAAGPPQPQASKFKPPTDRCYLCGGRHMLKECPDQKESGCLCCGGPCERVKRCPHSWYSKEKAKFEAAQASGDHAARAARGPVMRSRSPSIEVVEPPRQC